MLAVTVLGGTIRAAVILDASGVEADRAGKAGPV